MTIDARKAKPAELHESAAWHAEQARQILTRTPEELDGQIAHLAPYERAVVASAHAQLSTALSSLAWSPIFTPEFIEGITDDH